LRPYINEFTLTKEDVEPFAVMSGDVNPMHVDEAFAHDDVFHKIIAHGMWGGALISMVLRTELPGAGTIYCSQTLNFRRPVREKNAAIRCVVLDCRIVNQNGMVVSDGAAEIIAPTKKVRRGRVTTPEVHIEDRGAKHRLLIAHAQKRNPISACA
jgi:acyl dehydratase